jgi:hypothetical protein
VSAGKDGAGDVARLISYAVIGVVSAGLFLDSRGLPTTRWEVLGAGAFPQIVFGLLVVLAVMGLVDGIRKLPPGALGDFGPAALAWLRKRYLVGAIFGLFALYLVSLPVIGFAWATFGFLMGGQALLAPRTPRAMLLALVIALVFSFGLNAVFAELFNVFLPRAGV